MRNFPNEIWKNILVHLDKENLKKCLLVSSELREIIIHTPELMRKLQVIFFNENWQSKISFIEEFGFYVRSIKFDDCGFRSMSDLKKILTLTPNVETLIFYNCFILEAAVTNQEEDGEAHEAEQEAEGQEVEHPIRHYEAEVAPGRAWELDEFNHSNTPDPEPDDDDIPLELRRLTHLHLDSCNIAEKLVHNLRNCNTLKYFKITFYYQAPVNYFTDFLCQQDNLQELFCVGWSDMVFKSLFKDDISKERIHFKLKKFTIECELGYHENFSKFLRSQAAHITHLEMTCYNINFHYYRLLFTSFYQLKKLVLPTDWFLTDDRANEIKNCRIRTLKELELVGSNDDIVTFKTVVDIFPNLEVLRCENLMYFSLNGIIEKFTKLRHIKAENFRIESLLFVSLPSLEILETSYLYPMALGFLWSNFAENCPNIQQLFIKDIGHFKLNESIKREIGIIIENLKHFKKLAHCEIISSPQDPMVNSDEDQHEIQLPQEHPFYKVIIANSNSPDKQPIIKLSHYFAHNCADNVNVLKETFAKCDIVEI